MRWPYCSKISKKVSKREADREKTEISKTDPTLIPWISGLSGPIDSTLQ